MKLLTRYTIWMIVFCSAAWLAGLFYEMFGGK
jgi:hypothetical protein